MSTIVANVSGSVFACIFHSLHDCFSAVDGFLMLCFIFVFLSYQTFGGVDVRGA